MKKIFYVIGFLGCLFGNKLNAKDLYTYVKVTPDAVYYMHNTSGSGSYKICNTYNYTQHSYMIEASVGFNFSVLFRYGLQSGKHLNLEQWCCVKKMIDYPKSTFQQQETGKYSGWGVWSSDYSTNATPDYSYNNSGDNGQMFHNDRLPTWGTFKVPGYVAGGSNRYDADVFYHVYQINYTTNAAPINSDISNINMKFYDSNGNYCNPANNDVLHINVVICPRLNFININNEVVSVSNPDCDGKCIVTLKIPNYKYCTCRYIEINGVQHNFGQTYTLPNQKHPYTANATVRYYDPDRNGNSDHIYGVSVGNKTFTNGDNPVLYINNIKQNGFLFNSSSINEKLFDFSGYGKYGVTNPFKINVTYSYNNNSYSTLTSSVYSQLFGSSNNSWFSSYSRTPGKVDINFITSKKPDNDVYLKFSVSNSCTTSAINFAGGSSTFLLIYGKDITCTQTLTVNGVAVNTNGTENFAIPCCNNDPVKFTISSVKGGKKDNYSYTWYINDVKTNLSNGPTLELIYGSTIQENQKVKCIIFDGNRSFTFRFGKVVKAQITATFSIPNSNLCYGSSVNVSASNISGSPSYDCNWYLNGSFFGKGSSLTINNLVAGNNTIYCKIQDSKHTDLFLQSSSVTVFVYNNFVVGKISDAIHDYGVDGTVISGTPATGGVTNGTSYHWYFTADHSKLNDLSNHSGWTDWTAAGAAAQSNGTTGCSTHLYFKRVETNSCGASSGVLSENSSGDGRKYSVLKTKIQGIITNSNNNNTLTYGNNSTQIKVTAKGGAGSNYSYSWRRKPKNGEWENLVTTTNEITPTNLTTSYTYECTIHDPYYDSDCKAIVSTDINVYPQLIAGNSFSGSISNISINYGDLYLLNGTSGSGGSSDLSYYWKKRKANSQNAFVTFNNNSGLSITVLPEINSEYVLITKDNVTGEEKMSSNTFIVYVNIYPGHISINNQDLDTTICYGGDVSIVSIEDSKGASGSYSYSWRYSLDNGNHYDTFTPQSWGSLTCDQNSLGVLTNNHSSLLIYRIVRDLENNDIYAHSDTISIKVLPEFKVRFSSDDTICYGTVPDTLLVYPSGGTNNYSYSWYYKDIFYGNVLLSETDSLYNWNNLKFGVPEQIGITPYRVEVSDNCGSSNGFGTKGNDFNIYMLGNLSLSSPAFYSTLDEAGSGKSIIDHDYGKEKIVYAKIPDNQMPIGGSGNFIYRWYGKNISNNWDNGYDNSNLTSLLIDCQLLTDTMLYRYSVTDLSCQNNIYYSDNIQLNIISFNKPVLNNNQVQQICYNSIPEPIRMTTRPGVGNYIYSWYKSVDGGQTYSELLSYVGDTLVFVDVANNRLTSDALFKVRVQLGTGSNARYLESDPITVQVVSQVNPGRITIGNGGNGSIVDNDTVIYNMTSPLLRNLQSADGGHINASSVSYQWYKKEGAQTIFGPIDGAINADYQPGQVKLTTSYYRAVNDVCASSYSNIITVNVKNVSISENIGGNNGGNSENGGGNNNGGNNGNNGGNNNGGESNNGTQNHEGSLDLTPDLDYLGDDFVYQGGGIWEKTSSNNPLKKARYCRGSNVNLNLNVDIVGTYIWLDDSDNEIKKGSKFSISNIQNDTIVKAQIYDTEGVLVLEQLYVITVVDAYPEFKASKVHVEAGESVRFTNSTKDLKSALWSFGDGTDVSFADEPWHYFVKPGTFNIALTVVNKLGCKSTLTKNEYIIVDEYSGSEFTDVNDNKSFDVQIFPNPVKDILYVRGGKDLSIKMFSSQGTILFSADNSNDFDIDMSNLSEGVYMLKISDGSWTISRKVIKQ